MGDGKQQCQQQQQLQGGPQQSPQQQVTVMAVATADVLMAVEVTATVAAMMGNSTGMATMTSDSGITGDNNRQQQQ